MRRIHLFGAVAAFILACVAHDAKAATSADNGSKIINRGDNTICFVSGADTTCVTWKGDPATGAGYVSDVLRDRDQWAILNGGQPVINDTLTVGSGIAFGYGNGANAAFAAESSTVITSGTYTHFALFWRVIPAAGDTTTKVRLAWQIRGHLSTLADTTSTFAWVPKQWDITNPGTFTAFATNDTTVAKVTSTVGITALNNEFTTYSDPKWYAGVGAAYATFSEPNGRMLPLIDQSGVWFWAPYLSVRVRCLTGASKPKVIAYLVGRP